MAIILSGCGGGYDIFGSLLMYQKFLSQNEDLFLVNYSFTDSDVIRKFGIEITKFLYKIEYNGTDYDGDDCYFPELYLSKEIKQPIYAIIDYPSCQEIIDAYNTLLNGTECDTIYLIDGGCDVIMTGSEKGLGTPLEDIMHMLAVSNLNIKNKFICVVGANIDVGHGILQSDVDDRLQVLDKISEELLDKDCDHVKFYCDVFSKCNPSKSIVHSLLVASINGHTGYFVPEHLKNRIVESAVNLSDQTKTLYIFDLNKIIVDNVYINRIKLDMDSDEVDRLICAHQGILLC